MKIKSYLIGSILIILSSIYVGCYTMLSHPAIVEEQSIDQNTSIETETLDTFEPLMSDVNHGENCIDCHTQRAIPLKTGYMGSDITIYEENHGHISEYYWQITPSASYYYSKPWWANEFYYTPVPSQQLGSENDLPTPNDFSRRRPSSNNAPGASSSSIGGSSGSSALSKQLTTDDGNANTTTTTTKRASTGNRQNANERSKQSSGSSSSKTRKTSSKTSEAK